MNTFMIKDNAIIVYIDYTPYNIDESHRFFKDIRRELQVPSKDIDWEKIQEYVDIARGLVSFSQGNIEVKRGVLLYKGQALHNSLVKRIIQMRADGFDITPMLNFLENLMQNPSKASVDELFEFLEVCDLPITQDGHFIAYKVIRGDWTDKHTGTMDNSIGKVLEMPRNQVDDNRHRTCSSGLHFCSKEYIRFFRNGSSDRLVALKINPRDVVSIPSDYNNTKGRACRYEIIKELESGEYADEVESLSVWGTEDADEYEDYFNPTHVITSKSSKFQGSEVEVVKELTANMWNKKYQGLGSAKQERQALVKHRNGTSLWMNASNLEKL